MDPFGAVFFDRVEYSSFEALKDQAVGAFHLAVAPWVSHEGVVYIDAAVLAEVPKLGSGEGGAQVRDDPVGHSKPVCYFFDELGCLGRRCSCDRLNLDPLCELVDGDEYVSVAALCRLEWSNRVESPAGEWPGRRDRPQGLSRDVLLFGKELASRTSPDDDLGVSQGRWPVEA